MKKLITLLLIFQTLIFTLPNTSYAEEVVNNDVNSEITTQNQDEIKAKAYIAADAKTGQILEAKNINEMLPIASMTKMISMAIVIDQIREHKLNWDDKITISEDLSNLSMQTELSNVPLVAGESYTVKDLFNASIIESANACVMALADKIAGDQQNFIALMKEKLNNWNVKDYHIITTTGLNNSFISKWQYPGTSNDDENKMTAKGMAIVASHIVNDYPEFLESSKQTTAMFAGNIQMTNWNMMLPTLPVYTEGVDGLKTGTTDKAGACFAGTIKRNNWRIVTVVMNAENGQVDKTARFVETKKLMEKVYNNYHLKTLAKNSTLKNYTNIKVENAKQITQPIVMQKNITFATKKDNYSFKVIKNKELTAPTNKNTTCKTLEIKSSLGYLEKPITFNLVTKNNIEKANIFVRLGREIKSFFN